jgi:hypothetical protein
MKISGLSVNTAKQIGVNPFKAQVTPISIIIDFT